MDLDNYVQELVTGAKQACRQLAKVSSAAKDNALLATAEIIGARRTEILAANARDLAAGRKKGLARSFLDRLELNEKRLSGLVRTLQEVAALPDPVGEIIDGSVRPSGLWIRRVRVPLGVVLVIYESRPNVTVDAAALCLKSGNASILRGGSDSYNSNRAIHHCLVEGLQRAGIPEAACSFVETTGREAVGKLLQTSRYIDVVAARGGKSLIERVTSESKIPVIKHYEGICHTYVDRIANWDLAEKVCVNAKVQRPGVCNAMETLLVHEAAADSFLPRIAEALRKEGVELRGCPLTLEIVPDVKPATEEDWSTEYLDLILSIKVVPSLEEAIAHIARYGSGHSDAIITTELGSAEKFTREVDSAAVYVNTSTRFTDGGEFGLGAEIGISTDKLHARGPVGLRQLTSYKYVVVGDGQIRQ